MPVEPDRSAVAPRTGKITHSEPAATLRAAQLLRLPARSITVLIRRDLSNDAELFIFHQENVVLRQQVARIRAPSVDRT